MQAAQGPWVKQVDILEAHPLGLALVEGDLDLLPQGQDPGGMAFVKDQAVDTQIGLMYGQNVTTWANWTLLGPRLGKGRPGSG